MNEEKIKHLEFIQGIITRMNTNSFQLKELSITITAALLAVYASTENILFILLSIFQTIIFWFLDAYYLMQERKFRGLYDDVAEINSNRKDIKPFQMRPDYYKGGKYSYFSSFKSTTVSILYFCISLILFLIYFYLSQCS